MLNTSIMCACIKLLELLYLLRYGVRMTSRPKHHRMRTSMSPACWRARNLQHRAGWGDAQVYTKQMSKHEKIL